MGRNEGFELGFIDGLGDEGLKEGNEGDDVGFNVGSSEDPSTKDAVDGCEDGFDEGDKVRIEGYWDGILDGRDDSWTAEGFVDGPLVGFHVGRALEGRGEGCFKGIVDGTCVGLFVGGNLIIWVGFADGWVVQTRNDVSNRNDALDERHAE